MFGHAHYQVTQLWNTNGKEKSVYLYEFKGTTTKINWFSNNDYYLYASIMSL
jgi:hypothetical protein